MLYIPLCLCLMFHKCLFKSGFFHCSLLPSELEPSVPAPGDRAASSGLHGYPHSRMYIPIPRNTVKSLVNKRQSAYIWKYSPVLKSGTLFSILQNTHFTCHSIQSIYLPKFQMAILNVKLLLFIATFHITHYLKWCSPDIALPCWILLF